MRFSKPALALTVTLSLVSSMSFAQSPYVPRAASNALVAKGVEAQNSNDTKAAYDYFESALAYDPRNLNSYIGMAIIAETDGLYGKALRLYEKALVLDGNNPDALLGQGRAYVAKGAMIRAKQSLARLQVVCGTDCEKAQDLSNLIAAGPPQQPVSVATKDIAPQPEAKAAAQ